MNKTISINLGGSVFNIEEDAYASLKDYLDKINSNFTGDPSGAEIMADIEARISEIFHEKNIDRKNVVTKTDVDRMISVMGKPEDYRMGEDDRQGEPKAENSLGRNNRHPRRKIFRDTDDAVIAGVCSGLSHYFRVDPLVIRLVVVVLTFASIGFPGVLGYLIFWALVPAASSTAEKLQMRGEAVNIENIGKFAKDEARNAAERMSKFGKQASQSINKNGAEAGRVIGKILSLFFGFVFIMMGLGLLAGLVAMLAFSEINFFGFDGNNWDTMNQVIFGSDGTLNLLMIGFVIVMIVPAIALLYNGIKLITGTSQRIKGLGIALFSLFIIGIFLLIFGGVKTGRQFIENAEINNSYLYPENVGDTLYLDVWPDEIFIGRTSHQHDFSNLVKISGQYNYFGEPIELNFEPTSAQQFKVTVSRKSQGGTMNMAGNFARNIEYNFSAADDTLKLMPWFTTPSSDLYRGQRVEVTVHVPVGKHVHFGNNASLLTWQANNSGALRMENDGLEDPDDVGAENLNVSIEHPAIKITEDSVIIKSGDLEIKQKRN
jgi:phage shock protein PspC (stress-responsive transcriptional regulator)/NADH:ubiquinone oxidoreductase subunit 6 (subunit J)